MVRPTLLYAFVTGLQAAETLAFIPVESFRSPTAGLTRCSTTSSMLRRTSTLVMSSCPPSLETAPASASASAGGQTRSRLIETLWRTALTAGVATALSPPHPALAEEPTMVTSSGLKIKKLVEGRGPSVELGDLIGVRFKGNYGTYEFDNIFNTAEPYYTRAGVGTLVKGVEEATLMMKVGDKWLLTCPPSLAFGNKGRPPSPGRPRIPPGAEVEYVVELVALPGKEEDMLNSREDSFTGDAFDSP